MGWTLPPWDFLLILLVLGILVPWRGAVRVRKLLARPQLDTGDRLALYASTIAFQWLAVAVVAWRAAAHQLTATQLGFGRADGIRTAAVALGVSLLFVASQFLGLRRMAQLPPERRGFIQQMAEKVMPQNLVERLVFIALVSTVSLCEEFLYRGFVLAVIQDAAAGSILLAALGSSLLFAFAHIYQGKKGLLSTFLAGMVFSAVRIWTASLAPGIVAHLLADLVAGLAAPRILSDRGAQRADKKQLPGNPGGVGEEGSRS